MLPITIEMFSVLSVAISVLLAQETRVYSQPGVNHQVEEGSSNGTSRKTEKMRSINGRMVPLESVEERVIRQDANGKTVERTIRRFDGTGQPAPPEKLVIEERLGPGGARSVSTAVYHGDMNGHMEVSERSRTEERRSGSSTTAQTTVERPTLNGGFETVERRELSRVETPGNSTENTTVFRRGENGFYEAARQVKETVISGSQTTENVAGYERGSTGTLVLHDQTLRNTRKNADGTESSEVDLYSTAVPGRADDLGARPRLIEHQSIERREAGTGTVVEITNARRPTLADPNRLGPSEKISEVLCRGDCKPKPQP